METFRQEEAKIDKRILVCVRGGFLVVVDLLLVVPREEDEGNELAVMLCILNCRKVKCWLRICRSFFFAWFPSSL